MADKVGLPMYRVSEGVRSTHGQDGAIVLDIRQGQMFNLNFVGSRILELLETGASESAIVDDISHKFEVSRDVAEGDVREFIESLKQHHLLEDPRTNGRH
jgi:Coenzyme PQQ synthesis protein D (PqqD)